MPKDILEVFKLSKPITVSTDPVKNVNTVELPKCPKCNKVPLKCPTPNDCGMENL